AYSPQKSVRNWMASTNASSVVVAPHNAHRGGGTLRNTVAHQHCCNLCAFSWIAVTARALNVLRSWKTHSVCFVAAALVIVLGYAQKASIRWAPLAEFDWS